MGFGKYVDTDIYYVFGTLRSTKEMKVYWFVHSFPLFCVWNFFFLNLQTNFMFHM